MAKLTPLLLCALVAIAASPAHAQDKTGPKKIYCWNEGGRRVCGDALPPSAVDNARTEINATSGLRTGQVDRALTDAERAAAATSAKLADALAREQDARERRDMAMAASYATEADLRRAYGERIVLVDEGLKGSRLGIANQRTSLVTLLRQAAELELQGKPVAKPLQTRIQNQHADLVRQQAIYRQQQHERSDLDNQLNAALRRYRELKNPAAVAAQ